MTADPGTSPTLDKLKAALKSIREAESAMASATMLAATFLSAGPTREELEHLLDLVSMTGRFSLPEAREPLHDLHREEYRRLESTTT